MPYIKKAVTSGGSVAKAFCDQISCAKFKNLHFATSSIGDTVELSARDWRSLIPGLSKKITPSNMLGGGGEATVYAINDKYVLRMFGGGKKITSKFFPVEDIFEGRNFGQAVAKTSDNCSINRRVNGEIMHKCNGHDTKTYMRNLREYVQLSDETLEEFVSDVAFINSKGWRIDQSNPENFLLDRKTGKIGIIDLSRKNSSSLDLYEPYGHDWILDPLVNGHDIFGIYKKLSIEERKEMFELISKLEKRILPLCKKYDIPVSKWNKENYMFTSLLNFLDLKDGIDVSKVDDLFEPIIYARYPEMIPKFKAYASKD